MDAPLVSIITPSFNQGRFLRRAIESVLSQDYAPIEYLVLDGGSTDESLDILRGYGERFHWKSRPDGGQAAAINAGLRQARGEILAYLNSDDELKPGAVTAAVRALRAEPRADLVYGEAEWIDEVGNPLGHYPTEEFSRPRLLERCFLCQPATFWRRRVLNRVGYFDARLYAALDYDYWLRMADADCVFLRLPRQLAASRVHPRTKTQGNRERCLLESIQVCSRWGPVAEGHFQALWEHRQGQDDSRGRILRLWPGLAQRLAFWQWRWQAELQRQPRLLAAAVLRSISRRSTAALGLA